MNDLVEKAPALIRCRDELREELAAALRHKQEADEYCRSVQHRIEALEAGILNDMAAMSASRLEGPGFSLSRKQKPPHVAVVDIGQVPAEHKRTVPEQIRVDKKSVLKAYREHGEIPPGCDVVCDWKLVIK